IRALGSPAFNEAADDHPRKHGLDAQSTLDRWPFNEAADDHPRKHAISAAFMTGVPPSMRPRMIIRGNWWCGSGKASCTPAFNEAADNHPRKRPYHATKAQATLPFNEAAA